MVRGQRQARVIPKANSLMKTIKSAENISIYQLWNTVPSSDSTKQTTSAHAATLISREFYLIRCTCTWMCMCCVFVCIHGCMYVHVWNCVCVFTCASVCGVCVCVCTGVYVCMCVYMCACVGVFMCACVCVHAVCVCACVCVYRNTNDTCTWRQEDNFQNLFFSSCGGFWGLNLGSKAGTWIQCVITLVPKRMFPGLRN